MLLLPHAQIHEQPYICLQNTEIRRQLAKFAQMRSRAMTLWYSSHGGHGVLSVCDSVFYSMEYMQNYCDTKLSRQDLESVLSQITGETILLSLCPTMVLFDSAPLPPDCCLYNTPYS